jgi:hypothetical protein
MSAARILWPILLISLLPVLPAVGADGLVVASSVTESHYCAGPNGGISLNLRVHFTYRNVGAAQVVLPRFSRLSGYTLFRGDADLKAHRVTAQVSFRLPEIFHALKVDPSEPSSLLFESIPPGGIAGRIDEVSIPLTIPGKDGSALLGTSLLIQFSLDNWPGSRHIAESRRVWERLGTLWASKDTAPAVRVDIESNPVAAQCFPRVD